MLYIHTYIHTYTPDIHAYCIQNVIPGSVSFKQGMHSDHKFERTNMAAK